MVRARWRAQVRARRGRGQKLTYCICPLRY